jgi:hypothetical protein
MFEEQFQVGDSILTKVMGRVTVQKVDLPRP